MVKISMTTPGGASIDRIPAWITRVTQDLDISPIYDGRFWNPSQKHQFKHGHSKRSIEGLKIYEAHGESSMEYADCSRYLISKHARDYLQGV
jgi:1,4-alpha-glucan branching enzyme